jgi:hypothetical protein
MQAWIEGDKSCPEKKMGGYPLAEIKLESNTNERVSDRAGDDDKDQLKRPRGKAHLATPQEGLVAGGAVSFGVSPVSSTNNFQRLGCGSRPLRMWFA